MSPRPATTALLVLTALVPGVPAAGTANESGTGVEVVYLGNAGFYLTDGRHHVLIDALFGEGLPGYTAVPQPLRSRIERAQPPFDEVELVLATHHHHDHFEARAVGRHLERNPAAVFVSTPQALAELARLPTWFQISGRVQAVAPPVGERVRLSMGSFELEVLDLHHGRDRDPPVANLGFLIELGGKRFLHLGDTQAAEVDFAPYGLDRAPLDVLMAPFWYLAFAPGHAVLTRTVPSREVIAMHLPTASAPPSHFAPFAGLDELVSAIGEQAPAASVPLESGVRVELRELAAASP